LEKAKNTKSNKDKMTFEESLKMLEDIAEKLENGELGLDASIKEFENGINIAKLCHEKLEEAERKIEILQKGESGKIKKREIKVKEDTGEIHDDEDMQGSLL
jgi:exodeoxyribonuclease VII small subunit